MTKSIAAIAIALGTLTCVDTICKVEAKDNAAVRYAQMQQALNAQRAAAAQKAQDQALKQQMLNTKHSVPVTSPGLARKGVLLRAK